MLAAAVPLSLTRRTASPSAARQTMQCSFLPGPSGGQEPSRCTDEHVDPKMFLVNDCSLVIVFFLDWFFLMAGLRRRLAVCEWVSEARRGQEGLLFSDRARDSVS